MAYNNAGVQNVLAETADSPREDFDPVRNKVVIDGEDFAVVLFLARLRQAGAHMPHERPREEAFGGGDATHHALHVAAVLQPRNPVENAGSRGDAHDVAELRHRREGAVLLPVGPGLLQCFVSVSAIYFSANVCSSKITVFFTANIHRPASRANDLGSWRVDIERTRPLGRPGCRLARRLITYNGLSHLQPRHCTSHAPPALEDRSRLHEDAPKVRELWEQCSAAENRSLTNMFEVMVREYAKKLGMPALKQTQGTKITTKRP